MPIQSLPPTVYVLLALLLAFATPAISAQDPTAPLHTATRQELDIVKVLVAQEAAWNRGDIEAFAEAYKDSPDTLFLTNHVNHGFAGLVDEYRHDYPTRASMGVMGFSDLEVHSLDDNFAVCIGKYQLDRNKKDGGHAEGLFSLVLEKTDKGWKIVVDHTT